jgi:hypothetical protein
MEIKMKNVRIGLSIFVLVCLVCVFAPCASAQEGGDDDPCCHNVPSGIHSLNSGAIQMLNSAPLNELSVPAEAPAPVQMSSDTAAFITGKTTGMPFLAEARKLNYVK